MARRSVMASKKSDPEPSTSSTTSPPERSLRKRRLNLNTLSSGIGLNAVCQISGCGIRLRDGESLDWHYEGHLGQEVDKLERLKVRNPNSDPETALRRRVRESAVDKIKFNRQVRANRSRLHPEAVSSGLPRCPVCAIEVDDVDFQEHLEVCLQIHEPDEDHDEEDNESGSSDVEIDALEGGFETYTWAGHTRVRATSLVEGGLRGANFVSIQKGDEDTELDVENDEVDGKGAAQYTEADIIAPLSETAEERSEREQLQQALSPEPVSVKPAVKDDVHIVESDLKNRDVDLMSMEELKQALEDIKTENGMLRQQTLCNICYDVYVRPVVSVVCWHVHCEQCWLRALGTKKLCPQCKIIIQPRDLRRIFL